MEKGKAIQLLEKCILEIEELKKVRFNSPQFTAWKSKTNSLLEKIFGKNSRQLEDFGKIFKHQQAGAIIMIAAQKPAYKIHEIEIQALEEAKALLNSFKEQLIDFGEIEKTQRKFNDVISELERIFDRFYIIARQIEKRHNNRPTLEIIDEYDVQDLLHALLKLFFDDIRREEWTPSYAGGAARMDFLLKNEKIVIEVKKTRKGLTDKQIGDQLLQDIERYKKHSDCDYLICFVYDPEGRIGNPRGLEKDLSKEEDGFRVSVYVRP